MIRTLLSRRAALPSVCSKAGFTGTGGDPSPRLDGPRGDNPGVYLAALGVGASRTGVLLRETYRPGLRRRSEGCSTGGNSIDAR